jgi:hypothetical protein
MVSMTEWNVWLEFAHELTFGRIEDLLQIDLAPYHAVAGGGDGYATSSVRMTVEAETAVAAFDTAWRAVTRAEPIMPEEVLRFEVRPQTDLSD